MSKDENLEAERASTITDSFPLVDEGTQMLR